MSLTLPEVVLEVRQGAGRHVTYTLSHVDFVIGTVPGCDLRVPGLELPPLLCAVARYPGGVCLRKLVPTQVLLLNGQSAGNTDLADGDRLTIGSVDIVFRVQEVASPSASPEAPALEGHEEQEAWRTRCQQLEAELAEARAATPVEAAENVRREKVLQEREWAIAAREQAAGSLAVEVEKLRSELDHVRRDRDARADAATLKATVSERADELAQLDGRLQAERQQFLARQQQADTDLARREEEVRVAEERVTKERRDFEERQRTYEADVIRLHRQQGNVEEREQGLAQREREQNERRGQLEKQGAEIEEQVAQLGEWRAKLTAEAEQLAEEKKAHDELAAQATQRAAQVDGQQATLAALRSKLERMRDDVRQQEQQLDEQRAAQDASAATWLAKWQELQQLKFEVENERQQHIQERQQWVERGAVMEAAVKQMRQAQENLARDEERIRAESEDLDRRLQQVAEQEEVLESRLTQLGEAQHRLESERLSIRERTLAVMQGEQAREALQDQLRRRAEELNARQKEIADHVAAHQDRVIELEERRAELERQAQEIHQQQELRRLELEARSEIYQRQQAEMAGIEEKYRGQAEQIVQLRRGLAEERLAFEEEQRAAVERQAEARTEFETLHRDGLELQRQLPELELRAGTALDRLGHAREQLRGHLAEIHQYVRHCQDDLEGWRTRLRADVDGLQDQERTLRHKQDEHRLAMAGFRQQLIDWHGQIAEMKRVLGQDATRLGHRQARVEEQVREIDETSQRLARQAEALEVQQREVADRRLEVDRHLGDMREWYRQKLRDLAGIPLVPSAAEPVILPANANVAETVGEDGEPGIIPTQRSILMLGPIDPADRRLGEVLGELQLIDNDALTALLAEARRQRRSLRQVLLSSGVITLYQLAQIEAGNVQGLMLGPVRVIDRIRVTAQEAVYRVFDPRRGSEAILRHLTEAEMLDAVRPDEFRQRFAQAILSDPHLANTLEMIEINARPAALQEWISGLPATDWPPLAAAPGVCCRLLTQAAQGLAAAHRAGLAHGHLSDGLLVLTGEGALKICGLGEPAWLVGHADEEADFRGDLRALGRIASGWCTPSGVRRGPKTKPLPEALVSVLFRLAADGETGYRDVAELLLDLEKASAEVPANTEAWERLLKYVREHGTPEALVRQSA